MSTQLILSGKMSISQKNQAQSTETLKEYQQKCPRQRHEKIADVLPRMPKPNYPTLQHSSI